MPKLTLIFGNFDSRKSLKFYNFNFIAVKILVDFDGIFAFKMVAAGAFIQNLL